MQFILMRQSRKTCKYTDLSSQPFDVIDPCTTVSHNLWISMEQLMNVEILAVLLSFEPRSGSLYKSDNYSMTVSIQLLPSAIICLVLYRLSKALGNQTH